MEEKIAEVRDLVSGMETGELVDIDVNIDDDSTPPAPATPMEGVLATRKDIMKVEARMDEIIAKLKTKL